MIDPEAIETALAASLPPDLAYHTPAVARAIADAIAGAIAPEDLGQRLSDAGPGAALAALQGRSIVAAGATVRFEAPTSVVGSVGTFQQITISGGSVGGPIIGSIQVMLPLLAPLPPQSRWHIAHPYPMPPNFVGRDAERAALSAWLDHDRGTRVLTLRALGGFGKSALAWHWLTSDVDEGRWPRVLWWSFEGADADLGAFLRAATAAFGGEPHSRGIRQMADDLLHQLRQPGTLIVLDAFEHILCAFAGLAAAHQRNSPQDDDRVCADPIAEHLLRGGCALPGIEGKLLITTRLRPQALEVAGSTLLAGCRELEVSALDPEDAANFLRAEGVRGVDADVVQACARSGCHPLSLRLLAGIVMNDLRRPGDLRAAGMGVLADLNALLSGAYNRLAPPRRALLSRIACFRGAVSYDVLRAVAEQPDTLDADLRDILNRGLLSHDRATGRFDMHQIVRRYAYDQLAAGHQAVHAQLRDYFAAALPPPAIEQLDQLQPVIELYNHTLLAGQPDDAWYIYNYRLHRDLYYRFGAYQLLLQLLDAIPRDTGGVPLLAAPQDQIWTLLYSGICSERLGDPARAMVFARQAATLSERSTLSNHTSRAHILLAMPACDAGFLKQAVDAINAAVRWLETEGDANWYGIAIRSLGRVLLLCGRYDAASAALSQAHAIYGDRAQFNHGRSVTYENESSSHYYGATLTPRLWRLVRRSCWPRKGSSTASAPCPVGRSLRPCSSPRSTGHSSIGSRLSGTSAAHSTTAAARILSRSSRQC